ncbi:hypothetical protein Kisp02_31890 [Kineosporia sp. NBRC 101731]|nr:hypothetical protein Kisp02_31890 [Kineosporia sp. NBRC 101731]
MGPSDPDNPPLGLSRVGNAYEIRMPECATGISQSVTLEGVASPEVPDPQIYWEVERPWPENSDTAHQIVVGRVTPDMKVIHEYTPPPSSSEVYVSVGGAKGSALWLGYFDLSKVGSTLNLGLDYDDAPAVPDPEVELNEQAGCE